MQRSLGPKDGPSTPWEVTYLPTNLTTGHWL